MPRRSSPQQLAARPYDARVQTIEIHSAALGVAKRLFVYLPPDLPPGARAPSVYFLRGHEREWINPAEDQSRDGANVIDAYLRLRAAGRLGPLILVFPGLASDDNTVPSVLVNMRAPQLANGAPGIGSGRFADYFFDELIPYVDAHFPTMGAGRARGLIGFSLGGFMAAKAAAERPDLFASAGAYDGTFLYAADRGRRVRAADSVIRNPMFDAAFGVPRDTRFIAHSSPANLIVRGDVAALARVTWLIGYGPERHEPWQANFYRGEHLVACLAARGLANALPHQQFGAGDHTWRTADTFAELTLPLHEQALRAAALEQG
ncbi:MAG TPA: alpha/beta hydrolase-fold protein [Kouleothrix sp.]|uniref:alpha/beta hydrolase n=1 Tax=Kouleothrix sp. TaxID=2779161 RepID=UPI002C0DC98A|nr:alpha/beta hydrolase-fold protein [Kouleothrix sp.]HRC77847.1 alpha/beta hydrolase-fold protein [Kouleothrix sp.]